MRTGAREAGDQAEEAVVRYLIQQGYEVRSRNFTCRDGGLDVEAERGQTPCFVEVRMLSTAAWGDPSHTVSAAQQRREVTAALHYLLVHRIVRHINRVDVA